jgi:hypothetical protein
LLCTAVSISNYSVDGRMNNDELERIFKEEVMAKLKYYPGICIY